MYFRRCPAVHVRLTCHAPSVEPTNDPEPISSRLDKQGYPRGGRAGTTPQINTLRPAYTACTSIRRSTIVVVLACSCPRIFRVLDQAIVKPRDCSVRRPHTSHLSLRDLSNGLCSQHYHTRRYTPCPHPFFHPRVCRGSGVGSYRADATEAARDRRAYAALPYRDEGLVVQMGFLFASPVRGRTTNLPTSRVRQGWESVMSGQKAKSLHFKRCYRHSRYASSSSSVYSHHPAVRVSLSLDDTGTDMCTHVMSWASFTSRALRRAQTCGIT